MNEFSEMSPKETMEQFESLGDNCEFGIAQRKNGAEPLGLLRWASTPPELLLRVLSEKFAGLGNDLSAESPEYEWFVTDHRYDWRFHTWQGRNEITNEEIVRNESNRLRFLSRKLMEQLTEGTKIFVYKVDGDMPQDKATEFAVKAHNALLEYGPNKLLCVARGTCALEEIRPNLLLGALPKFANINVVDADTDGSTWLDLCKSALRAFQSAPGEKLM